MPHIARTLRMLGAGAALSLAAAGSALADGEYSMKDAPAAEGRQFTYAITLNGTSDYVFRGVSQTDQDPAFQAALDVSYGIFYAGVWGSNIDFLNCCNEDIEVDFYAGLKPVWGPVTFDFGVLYYWYPDSRAAVELDYVEYKAGYSMASPWIKGLTSGTTLYWSPDSFFETGDVLTVESNASYAFPQIGIFSPSISGTYGSVYGNNSEGFTVGGGAEDEYTYWAAGISLAVEKFTFDFRYWDSDIDVVNPTLGLCIVQAHCDERFVFSAKITLP